MIRMFCATALALSLLLAGGCTSSSGDADFDASIAKVQAGTPKAQVQRELGKPDEKQMTVAGALPAQSDPVTVQPGSRYETWTYYRGTRQFDVVLAGSPERPGQWVVHSVSNTPKEK